MDISSEAALQPVAAVKDTVAAKHPDWERYHSARRLTRDFSRGTSAVHAHADIYTPREGLSNNLNLQEDPYMYKIRSTWSEVYPATKAAKEAAIGMILSQPPSVPDTLPQPLLDFVEDVDGKGNHLMIYAREWADNIMEGGLSGTLIDLPKWPEGVARNAQTAKVFNIDPFWARYEADDIINWRASRVGKKYFFTMLVLRESRDEADGEFANKEQELYRVLRLDPLGNVTWELWKEVKAEGGAQYIKFEEGKLEAVSGQPLGFIPFRVTYGQKPDEFMVCPPPLQPIAELNLGYYRTVSDRRWSMHLHFSPPLLLKGRSPGPSGMFESVRLGAGSVIDVPPDGDGKFLSPGSEAYDPSEKELTRISQEMGTLSLAFLSRDRTGTAETATARRLEAQAGKSSLALLAQNIQDSLEELLEWTALFLGLGEVEVEVSVRTTYDLEKMDAQTITALNQVCVAGNLTLDTFLRLLKDGQVLPDSVDLADESEAVAVERLIAARRASDIARASSENLIGGPAAPTTEPT